MSRGGRRRFYTRARGWQNRTAVKRHVHRLTHELERRIDRRLSGRRRSGAVVVSPYRGFGRAHELLIRGRVLAEKRITRATEMESTWRNLVNAYRRFQSDEVADARVIARYRDAVVETRSDEEGFFQIRLEPKEMNPDALWHEIGVELEDGVASVAHAVVPPAHAQFGIISDIDDTIVQTFATSLARMAKTVLLQNAKSRLPFEGVADLYRALHKDANPLFYVSSSPWNMYELLHDFMNINGIPPGPMFLQNWGIDEKTFFKSSHTTHKLEQIQLLLDYYADLPFVLIGDSGQHDPEIYLNVIHSKPNRIRAAFIRDVTPDLRDHGVAKIIEEAKTAGVELLYVRDSSEALEHARRLSLL
jgi:phosphatidate phosphatase APP1